MPFFQNCRLRLTAEGTPEEDEVGGHHNTGARTLSIGQLEAQSSWKVNYVVQSSKDGCGSCKRSGSNAGTEERGSWR